jgi:proline dehydrogenase
MKQTAIIFLIEQLPFLKEEQISSLIKQALEMEMKQMEECYLIGRTYERGEQESSETYDKLTGFRNPNQEITFKEYYNKTFITK